MPLADGLGHAGTRPCSSRRFFCVSWEKYRRGPDPSIVALEPLEELVVRVIRQHPEYHGLMEHPEGVMEADFGPEGGQGNPFLHLASDLPLQDTWPLRSRSAPIGPRGSRPFMGDRCGGRGTPIGSCTA
ncbi:MAG: DUF1841 family protein [Gammaproteobacteria bacterium]